MCNHKICSYTVLVLLIESMAARDPSLKNHFTFLDLFYLYNFRYLKR